MKVIRPDQLRLYGVGFAARLSCAGIGVDSLVPWKPEKLKRRHLPEEDELLI